jgi:Dna[CI] antecedent, DciA
MREIADLLTQSLKRHGIERQVTAVRIVDTTQEILQNLLPEQARQDVKALSFFGEMVRVICKHPVAAQEVRRHKDALLAELARAFPSRTIRDIEIRLDQRTFQSIERG